VAQKEDHQTPAQEAAEEDQMAAAARLADAVDITVISSRGSETHGS